MRSRSSRLFRAGLLPLAALCLLLALTAAPATAKGKHRHGPKGADVRVAAAEARGQLSKSLRSAAAGRTGKASAAGAEYLRLSRRAGRKARKVLDRRGEAPGARSLRRVAALVDGGVDSYATILASAPPALQAEFIALMERLTALRADLVADLTVVLDELPDDVAQRISAALAAFYSDGDLQALIDALSDPEISAAIRAQLLTLIETITDRLEVELGDLGDLADLLPPEIAAQLQALLDEIDAQLSDIFDELARILGTIGGIPGGSGDLCSELEALFQMLGLPVPPGLCP